MAVRTALGGIPFPQGDDRFGQGCRASPDTPRIPVVERRPPLPGQLLEEGETTGVLISDLTGVVRGETERLWMPFAVWIVPAAAFLPVRHRRLWLAASVVLAIGLEVTVRLEW